VLLLLLLEVWPMQLPQPLLLLWQREGVEDVCCLVRGTAVERLRKQQQQQRQVEVDGWFITGCWLCSENC
jgi:hypothetical protein